jgi:hypothetical protein
MNLAVEQEHAMRGFNVRRNMRGFNVRGFNVFFVRGFNVFFPSEIGETNS